MSYESAFGDIGQWVDDAVGGVGNALGTSVAQQSLNDQLVTRETNQKAQLDRDIAAGSSIQVDLEAVATLYGQLASIYAGLKTQHDQLMVDALAAGTRTMRPSATGLAALLSAAQVAAGATNNPNSLVGNVGAVMKIIGGHQCSTYDCVQAYAKQENIVVDSFTSISVAADNNGRLPDTQIAAH
jgi:hypothetical protein